MHWVLEGLSKYSSRTLFKQIDASKSPPSWHSISYKTFQDDLERSAAYWSQNLTGEGLAQQDVVGIW
jgi:hypothetical protein